GVPLLRRLVRQFAVVPLAAEPLVAVERLDRLTVRTPDEPQGEAFELRMHYQELDAGIGDQRIPLQPPGGVAERDREPVVVRRDAERLAIHAGVVPDERCRLRDRRGLGWE